MAALDRSAPRSFLSVGFEPDDVVAVFLKSYETGVAVQRVVPLRQAIADPFLGWLRARNAARWNIYISVNAVDPSRRSRSRDAITNVRHVFLETDRDAVAFLAALAVRRDLPQPSFVMRTSPGRAHVLWRVREFSKEQVEALQKTLARDLAADPAATSCSQTTRIPGFFNHKYAEPYPVTLQFGRLDAVHSPEDFPTPRVAKPKPVTWRLVTSSRSSARERARAYLEFLPAAVSGQHGDLHTFQVCCRVVRGFDLDEDAAMDVLATWNARCVPPWSSRELFEKVRRARRYGRESLGGLLCVRSS